MAEQVSKNAGELGFFGGVAHSTMTAVDLGGPIMITLIVYALGVNITPVIRFMLAGFEFLTVGAIVLRIIDVIRRPRLADRAAERRERWEAGHPVLSSDGAEQDDD